MVLAIMQPYFFPYIGYFQLMAAADCFVFYDDAQYMKGGWINRNRILRDSTAAWWTFPVIHDDYRLPIRQRSYSHGSNQIRSLLGKIEGAYSDAPVYRSVFPLITELLNSRNDNVADHNASILKALALHLGIKCNFLSSSSIQNSSGLQGQARVVDICRQLGAEKFINPIGGLDLYENAAFAEAKIELDFLQARTTHYPQFSSPHLPFLSIIDVMMFNSENRIINMLAEYDLREPIR
jgi:hypothetical protein